jgi:hypothetical protein
MAKQKSLLGDGDHNFAVKVLLDQVLEEGKSLPAEVKEALIFARFAAWEAHEKKHKPLVT